MSKKRAHKTLSLEEKLTILDELSSKTHRQLAEIRHLYIANTHNDIHYYYNDIHYFNNPNISLIRPPSGPKLFGLVRVYCNGIRGYLYSTGTCIRWVLIIPNLRYFIFLAFFHSQPFYTVYNGNSKRTVRRGTKRKKSSLIRTQFEVLIIPFMIL